jgi:ABC-2 type transport system ATP-binding protein
VIEVTNLRKSYGELEAVRDVSFTVQPGEVLGLVGPNGAGKTTTLRCLAGILPPTTGRIVIAGRDLRLDPVGAKSALAYVPDDPRLFENLTVMDHVRFVARLYRVADAEARIPGLLEEFEIADKADELPGALSRGMKQKLAIACAFLHDPRAILLDEPLTGLDPIAIRKAKDAIVARARAGAAVIVSSHLLHLVEELAHRVLVIMKGQKAAHGTIAELLAAHPDLAAGAGLEEIFMRMATGRANGQPPTAAPPSAPPASSTP